MHATLRTTSLLPKICSSAFEHSIAKSTRFVVLASLRNSTSTSTTSSTTKPNELDPKRDFSVFSGGGRTRPSRTRSPIRTIDPTFRFRKFASQCDQVPRVLITGGMGQLGRSLASTLQFMFGSESVLLTDICKPAKDFDDKTVAFRYLNILDSRAIEEAVVNGRIDTIIHFSALLSAVAEQNVEMALQVNVQGVQNVLSVAKTYKLKVFIPSTIGVFGQSTPRQMTPDLTIQRPNTIYGVSKVYAELLGEYFCDRYGVDFRSLRFPGIISTCQPGGGTTDYSIQMFYDAILHGAHRCYLHPDTALPMMYSDDCMASVIQMLLAPSECLSLRTYNVTGFSLTPAQLADTIRQFVPHFDVSYEICPTRQRIANSWPQSLDDSTARRDWGWCPEFGLEATVETMLKELSAKLSSSTKAETTTETPTMVAIM